VNARAHQFPLVDSLRGIAALMIVATHVAWFSGSVSSDATALPYLSRLEAGVAVFFVISGFLLYRPFVKARLLDRPAVSTRAYAWRRFLRIVPAFWVALTLIAIWRGIDQLWNPRELAINYGFLQLYRGASPVNVIPQGWTLSVEVAFYAALPLWAWLMRRLPAQNFNARLRWELGMVGGLVLGSLAYNAVLVYTGAVGGLNTLAPVPLLASLPGYLDHLGLGMLLAVLSVWIEHARDGRLPQPIAFLARFPSMCWLIAITCLWIGGMRLALPGPGSAYTAGEYMERHLLNSVIAVALVLPAVFGATRQGLTRRVLGHPVLLYFGLISYSFYLYHLAVVDQLRDWGLNDLHVGPAYLRWYVLTVAGAALLGSVSYYLVERPALSLKGIVRPRPVPERAPVKV
jgi:peptidoglycan/LPS O-acetylase OafA/YrhL